ncbi:MAG: ferric reductase-like transmembrane domain-containing protein [Acidimicrobiales bacterium]
MMLAAAPSPLWYLTRGTGLVALILLTASVVFGILNLSRWDRPRWPRFLTAGLHRNVSLLVVIVLAVHILTAELDTFAPVGWLAVVIPFGSAYRPIWVGLGTVAFDLLLALVVTSLLRSHIGQRAWKALHWTAYLSWPVALVHGLGTGTDARLGWVKFVSVACTAAVVAAVSWRLVHGWPRWAGRRLAAGAGGGATILAILVWAVSGPLQPGWARRAGTPSNLLASPAASTVSAGSGQAAASSASGGPGSAGSSGPSSTANGTSSPTAAGGGVPRPPFSADLSGTLTQTGTGQVTINITSRVSGAMTGSLSVVLQGRSQGVGVSLESSSVAFGPTNDPEEYQGQVVVLNGDQLVASVTSSAGPALSFGINLEINPSSGAINGTLQVQLESSDDG